MPLDVTFQPRYESPAPEPGRLSGRGPLPKIFPNHKIAARNPTSSVAELNGRRRVRSLLTFDKCSTTNLCLKRRADRIPFGALSDFWGTDESLEKWLWPEPRGLRRTKTKEDTMQLLRKYGSMKDDIRRQRGWAVVVVVRQAGRFASARVPAL